MKKTLIATLIGLMGIGMVSCGKAGSNGGDDVVDADFEEVND